MKETEKKDRKTETTGLLAYISLVAVRLADRVYFYV
jgi:hypothetical protein